MRSRRRTSSRGGRTADVECRLGAIGSDGRVRVNVENEIARRGRRSDAPEAREAAARELTREGVKMAQRVDQCMNAHRESPGLQRAPQARAQERADDVAAPEVAAASPIARRAQAAPGKLSGANDDETHHHVRQPPDRCLTALTQVAARGVCGLEQEASDPLQHRQRPKRVPAALVRCGGQGAAGLHARHYRRCASRSD